MTTRADWLALAARAEAATGADRALDADVEAALGWPNAAWTGLARAFSASLDVALAVVPEGWAVADMMDRIPHDDGAYCHVRLWCPANSALGFKFGSNAATPALALLAAACRARAEEAGDG